MSRALRWAGLLMLLQTCQGSAWADNLTETQRSGIRAAYARSVSKIVRARAGSVPYPKGVKGVARIAFAVDRSGTVTSRELRESSGHKAVAAWAMKVVPVGLKLRPVPAGMQGPLVRFTVPLRVDGS